MVVYCNSIFLGSLSKTVVAFLEKSLVGQYTAGASRLANGLQRLNNEGANTLDSQLNKLNTPQMQGVIAQLNSNKIDSLVGQMSSLQELPGAAGQLYALIPLAKVFEPSANFKTPWPKGTTPVCNLITPSFTWETPGEFPR